MLPTHHQDTVPTGIHLCMSLCAKHKDRFVILCRYVHENYTNIGKKHSEKPGDCSQEVHPHHTV